jgi:hypothetical protein
MCAELKKNGNGNSKRRRKQNTENARKFTKNLLRAKIPGDFSKFQEKFPEILNFQENSRTFGFFSNSRRIPGHPGISGGRGNPGIKLIREE